MFLQGAVKVGQTAEALHFGCGVPYKLASRCTYLVCTRLSEDPLVIICIRVTHMTRSSSVESEHLFLGLDTTSLSDIALAR